MKYKYFIRLMIVTGFIFAQLTIKAQEFPIAVGSDTTFSISAAFDGTNYLAAIMGDNLNQNSITAQLVSPTGNLVGNRIHVDGYGIFPGAGVAFDGSNYLLVWIANFGNVYGQFINPSGNLVGTPITIAPFGGASSDHQPANPIVFSDSTYLVIFNKLSGYLYGQRVNKNGSLIGDQIQISGAYARDASIAYDGINYLAAWCEDSGDDDRYIYGQLISKSGALVGTNFLIDAGEGLSDNPTSIAFDGTRYLVAFHEQSQTAHRWDLFARFVTTSGTVAAEKITICDSTKDPFIASATFGNDRYLITWAQGSNFSLMGRFYNSSGVPIDTPFVIFNSLNNRLPVGGSMYGGNKFLAVATRVDSNFTDGDVYGKFIQPLTGVEDESNMIPEKFVLSQNYPNPFNPSTIISYSLPVTSQVSLKVYDVLGNEVATLVNDYKSAGSYDVDFNSTNLSSGVYFYQLKVGSYLETRKMILMK